MWAFSTDSSEQSTLTTTDLQRAMIVAGVAARPSSLRDLMKSRPPIVLLLALSATLLPSGTWPGAMPSAARPNVLLLFTDDMRADSIGTLGNPKTPQLHALDRRGFLMENAYNLGGNVPAVCTPSRNIPHLAKVLLPLAGTPRARRESGTEGPARARRCSPLSAVDDGGRLRHVGRGPRGRRQF
jgi:hypothetical protein